MKSRFVNASFSVLCLLSSGAAPRSTGSIPLQCVGIELLVEQIESIDAEHQSIVVAGQDGAGMWCCLKNSGHAAGLDAAGEIHDITKVNEGLVRVAVQRPFHQPAAEQGLLGWSLCHLDIGVNGTVIVVQRVARRHMLLSVAQGYERQGQGPVVSTEFIRRAWLRHEAGATGKQCGNDQSGDG